MSKDPVTSYLFFSSQAIKSSQLINDTPVPDGVINTADQLVNQRKALNLP